VNRPSEYIYIHDCISRKGGGPLVIGSETSGWIRHVKVENMKAIGSAHIVHLKSALTRGGGIEDIEISNTIGEDLKNFIKVNVNWNPTYSYAELPDSIKDIPHHWKVLLEDTGKKGIPTIRNVVIHNCSATNVRQEIISVEGVKESIIQNFKIENVKVSAQHAGDLKFVKNFEFKNVEFLTPGEDHLKVSDSDHVELEDCSYSKTALAD